MHSVVRHEEQCPVHIDERPGRHAFAGRQVVVALPDRSEYSGPVAGVAEDGALLVGSGGNVRRFHTGEVSLRPKTLAEYIGQANVRENLDVAIRAARARREPLDHVLLMGPRGLGKTSMAHVIANEMGVRLHQTSGPAIEKAGDVAAILTSLEAGDVLFIDEIHRLGRAIEEILYPALEDGRIDLVIGDGATARTISLDLAPFTLVGATTRSGLLSAPLRSRFGSSFRLDFYDVGDLTTIVLRSARILDVETMEAAAHQIAERSRGTPRVANRLLRRLRDYAQVRAAGRINPEVVSAGLEMLGVDTAGFDAMDRQRLLTIIEIVRRWHGNTYGGNPISCAASLATIELLEEEYLDNVIEVGQYTLDALQEIQARHPSLGDVRGKGLMIGVEFVKDKNTKEPNEEIRNKIENIGFEHGLLLLGCGKSTICLAPPLCITKKETDEALEIFEGAITLAEKEQGLL